MRQAALALKAEQDQLTQFTAEGEAAEGVRKAAGRAERAMRVAKASEGSTPETRLQALWAKDGKEIKKRRDAVGELDMSMEALAKKVRPPLTPLSLQARGGGLKPFAPWRP